MLEMEEGSWSSRALAKQETRIRLHLIEGISPKREIGHSHRFAKDLKCQP
jgi:hypothetical protein